MATTAAAAKDLAGSTATILAGGNGGSSANGRDAVADPDLGRRDEPGD